MNWIIKSTKKLRCHTNLNNLLASDWIDISEYNWFLSDLEVINYADYEGVTLPIDFREDYFTPSIEDFKTVVESDIQIIWGVISAVNKNENPTFDKYNFPFVEGNDDVWEANNFQVKNAVFEITAWDSSYTIVKFKNKDLSEKFKNYFGEEVIELEKYIFK